MRADSAEHAVKVVQTMAQCVNNLDLMDSIVPIISEMGLNHKHKGVTNSHYKIMEQALEISFQEMLGSHYNPGEFFFGNKFSVGVFIYCLGVFGSVVRGDQCIFGVAQVLIKHTTTFALIFIHAFGVRSTCLSLPQAVLSMR